MWLRAGNKPSLTARRDDGGEGSKPSSESFGHVLLTFRRRGEHPTLTPGTGLAQSQRPWAAAAIVGGDEGGDLASAPPAGVGPVPPMSECHGDACLAAVRSVLCSSELF